MIGDLHGISPRAASNCIHDVANAICSNMDSFITWPTEDELSAIKRKFYEISGLPGIFGAIDGTHVPILSPRPPFIEAAFVNRKQFHSINCQILCDSKLKIFSIDARWPGSCHDSFILRQSEVSERCEREEFENSWLLGDSGYPLQKWLMVPFRSPMTSAEERYNAAHRRARACVERCNGVLKMRWRCLTQPIMFRPARASKIIAACGALHNFASSRDADIPVTFEEAVFEDTFDWDGHIHEPTTGGIATRNALVSRFF